MKKIRINMELLSRLLQAVLSVGMLFFVGYTARSFYNEGVAMMRRQASDAFLQVMHQEILFRSNVGVSLNYVEPDAKSSSSIYFLNLSYDTPKYAWFISDGKRVNYRLDSLRTCNNVTNRLMDRRAMSCLFRLFPMNADTINAQWRRLLQAERIRTSTRIRLTRGNPLELDSLTVYSAGSHRPASADSLLSRYIGYHCEMGVTGYFALRWWQVLSPWQWFILLGLAAVLYLLLFQWPLLRQWWTWLRRKLTREVVVEKEVVINKEVYVYKMQVKGSDLIILDNDYVLDTKNQTFSHGEASVSMTAQSMALLRFFMQHDFQLSSAELEELWGRHYSQMPVYTAISRLRAALKKVSPFVINVQRGVYYLINADKVETTYVSTEASENER